MLDSIREANRELAVLLRRRGTSPEVGKGLRRAVQSLNVALAGPVDGRSEALTTALDALRGCLKLIQESGNDADHEQMPGIASALSKLFIFEGRVLTDSGAAVGQQAAGDVALLNVLAPDGALGPQLAEPADTPPHVSTQAPAVFPLALPPGVPAVVPPTTAPAHATSEAGGATIVEGTGTGAAQASEARPVPDPRRHTAVLASNAALLARIARLGPLHARRLTYADDVLATLADLAHVDAAIEREMTVLRWSGDRVLQAVRELLGSSPTPGQSVNAAVAFPHVQTKEAIARAFNIIPTLPATTALLRLALDSLRYPESPDVARRAKALFTVARTATLKVALLPLLIERGRFDCTSLGKLIDDPADEVAAAAAAALAWCPAYDRVQRLLERAGEGDTGPGAAMLFAAAALGAEEALAKIRRRLDSGSEGVLLIDALAVAGHEGDAERLLSVAARGGRNASRAVLAAAHLGHRSCLALPEPIPSVVGDAVVRWARLLVAGATATPSATNGRLLDGWPWSVAGAVERFASPDIPLRVRYWAGLELAVRTGVSAPSIYDPTAPAHLQASASARWRERYRDARVPSGRWFYFGRPHRLA